MQAIVIAGGTPQPDDALYRYTRGDTKALTQIAGKPMIHWVLEALDKAAGVAGVIVVGLPAKTRFTAGKLVEFMSSRGRLLDNVVAGIERARELEAEAGQVLLMTADVPAIQGPMIDWFVTTAMEKKADVSVGVCPRAVMETRFPEARPAYVKAKDAELCAAPLALASVRLVRGAGLERMRRLLAPGMNPVRAATALLGLRLAARLRFGMLSLDEAARAVSERLGMRLQPIVLAAAEPAMQVEQPRDFEMLAKVLGRRTRATSVKQSKSVKKARGPAKGSRVSVSARPRTAKPRRR